MPLETNHVEQSPILTRHRATIDALGLEVRSLVLLIRDDIVRTANQFAEIYRSAEINVLGARRPLTEQENAQLGDRIRYTFATSEAQRAQLLTRIRQPQVIIDAGNQKRAHKLSSFRQFVFLVSANGLYIVDELDSVHHPKYDDEAGHSVLDLLLDLAAHQAAHGHTPHVDPAAVSELSTAVRGIDFQGTHAVVHRSDADFFVKVRDWETDAALTAEYGDRWGVTLESRPATKFVSRAEVTSHGNGPIRSGRATFDLPERVLRRYTDVVCSARQIVRRGRFVLPDSWRHPHQRVLNNRQLAYSSAFAARYLDRTEPVSVRRLDGAFYYLDTELPGHFGHVTTEVLSRAWGWESARLRDPSIRALVSTARDSDEVPGYQREIFAALDICPEDVEVIGPREAVQVECLYGVTPLMENPYYIDPDLAETWSTLAANLPARSGPTPERIFVSRRPAPKRHCRQTTRIEEFFDSLDYTIVYPEDHPYAEQVAMFAGAKVIAGFGGSGMFNMMFAPTARILIISGNSYNAHNEHLFAAVNGNDLHYFWGQSDTPLPRNGRFSLRAFTSDFDFDLSGHADAIRELSQ